MTAGTDPVWLPGRKKMEHNSNSQLEDLLEIDERALPLETIESIARDSTFRKRYEKKYRNCLYSLILKSLTHELFAEKEAKTLWEEILRHMTQLNQILGRNVGVAVASLDYLTNIRRALSDPKIIEEHKSSFVAKTTIEDDLTGLYERDVFDVLLKKEVNQSVRNHTPLSLLMMDFDDFKKINDKFGHQAGDEVLRRAGRTLRESVRNMDCAARYGGEEFAVIMPNTEIGSAHRIAERIRRKIQKLTFKRFTMTVSIGVSEIDQRVRSPEELIEVADNALYKAKAEGKNRVVSAEENTPDYNADKV